MDNSLLQLRCETHSKFTRDLVNKSWDFFQHSRKQQNIGLGQPKICESTVNPPKVHWISPEMFPMSALSTCFYPKNRKSLSPSKWQWIPSVSPGPDLERCTPAVLELHSWLHGWRKTPADPHHHQLQYAVGRRCVASDRVDVVFFSDCRLVI